MFITKVTARGFKRGDFVVDLARNNVIHGDNWTRKTSVLDAVAIGLVGYHPAHGKTNEATFEFASGPELFVRLDFDTGAWREVRLWLEGNSRKKSVTGGGLAGLDDATLTVMLSADAYFGLGDTDRMRYVFANVPLKDAPTRDGIAVRIGEWLRGKGDEVAEYLLENVWARIDARDGKDKKKPKPTNIQEEIEALIEEVRVDWKTYRDHADMMQGTVNGLVSIRADADAPLDEGAVTDRKIQIERELAQLNEQKGADIAAFTQMKSDRVRRDTINRELNFSQKTITVDLPQAREFLALSEAKLSQTPAFIEADLDAPTQQHQTANMAMASALSQRRYLQAEIVTLNTELGNIESAEKCPYCGATGATWKVIRTEEITAKIAKLAGYVSTEETLITTNEKLVATAQAQLLALRERRELRTAVERRVNDDRQRVAKLEPALARATALNEELGRLMVEDAELSTRVESLQTRINILAEEQRGLDTTLRESGHRASQLKDLAKAETDRDASLKLKAAAEAAGKELQAIQTELVASAFAGLIETANRIFGHLLETPLGFRDGDVGTWREGKWISHRTFSGGEKALTYAAIQAALASRSPVRVMLVDEMGKFVDFNAERVAIAVIEASARGDLDQFVCVDPQRSAVYDGMDLPPVDADLAFKHLTLG